MPCVKSGARAGSLYRNLVAHALTLGASGDRAPVRQQPCGVKCFFCMLIPKVHKSIIVMNFLDTHFSRNVFEAVQKTRSTCFIGSKTTWLHLVVLNPVKTLLLMF